MGRLLPPVQIVQRVLTALDHELVEGDALVLGELLEIGNEVAGKPKRLVAVLGLFYLKHDTHLLTLILGVK